MNRLLLNSNSRLVTTPLFYVNSKPHIGHAYSLLLADIFSKHDAIKDSLSSLQLFSPKTLNFVKLQQATCTIVTGLDQHGYKIQKSALEKNIEPNDFVNQNSAHFDELFSCVFYKSNSWVKVKTCSSDHKKAVQSFWERLESSGHIYWDYYQGWYSVIDETFYSNSEVERSDDGAMISKSSRNHVELTKEYSCKLNIKYFRNFLLEWIQDGQLFLDTKYQKEFLQQSIILAKSIDQDIVLTRPTSRVHWGIGVPGKEKEYTIYVWLDALVGYLTACGFPNNPKWTEQWPAKIQIFGKDILKFHVIIWPALLKAVGFPLPTRFLCHSHLLSDNLKISKSLGNSVDYQDELKYIQNSDSIRFYLASLPLLNRDCSYNRSLCILTANELFSNRLGNLLSRISSASLNPDLNYFTIESEEAQKFLQTSKQGKALWNRISKLQENSSIYWNEMAIHKLILEINLLLQEANVFFDHKKPWKLPSGDERNSILAIIFEVLRLSSWHLSPIAPNISDKLSTRLDALHKKDEVDKLFILHEKSI